MNETYAIQLLSDVFNNSSYFNIDGLIIVLLAVLSMALISRSFDQWKVLALPVTVMWDAAGITPHFLWYALTMIMFVPQVISTEQISQPTWIVTGKLVLSIGRSF